MGNKQNKATPTPMLKVESKVVSCFDEQERPKKGIPRRIGNILVTRWIELKRREQSILEKARKAVNNGHAPPTILEELSEQLKEKKTPRVKYHPRILANILVRKTKPKPRQGLKIPKLTTTAARRIHQSFLRRDLERRIQEQRMKDSKLETNRTRSRLSVRQQAWTDTMPRKITSSGTTRSTQTISQPMSISRDISLRSFRTGESSGIGMSRASSMTSIASSKPRLLYTRERGHSLSEEGRLRDGHHESNEGQDEDTISNKERRQRIIEQRRKIRKKNLARQALYGKQGQAEQEQNQRVASQKQRRGKGTARRRNSEATKNEGPEPVEQKQRRRRPLSQQHPSGPKRSSTVPPKHGDSISTQTEDLSDEGQHLRRQGSGRRRRRTSFPKLKTITYQEYWRRRVLLSRSLSRSESEKDTRNFRLPKGRISKQQQEEDLYSSRQSIESKKNDQRKIREKLEESKLHNSLQSREDIEVLVDIKRQETESRLSTGSSGQRPPYSFSQRSRRFRDVAEEFLRKHEGLSHISKSVEINNVHNGSQQTQQIDVEDSKNRREVPASKSHHTTSRHRRSSELQSTKNPSTENVDSQRNIREVQYSNREEKHSEKTSRQKEQMVTKKEKQHPNTSVEVQSRPSRESVKQVEKSERSIRLKNSEMAGKAQYSESVREDKNSEDAGEPQNSEKVINQSQNSERVKESRNVDKTRESHNTERERIREPHISEKVLEPQNFEKAREPQNQNQKQQTINTDKENRKQSKSSSHENIQAEESVHVETVVRVVDRKNHDQEHAKHALHAPEHMEKSFADIHTQEGQVNNASPGIRLNLNEEGSEQPLEHRQSLEHSKQSNDHQYHQEHSRHSRSHEQSQQQHLNSTVQSIKSNEPIRNEPPLQYARIVPIVEEERIIQSQGSRKAQMFSQPREEQAMPSRRSSVHHSQGNNDQYFIQDSRSIAEGREMKQAEYGRIEPPLEYSQGERMPGRRNDVIYVDRGPVSVYEGRVLQPLQRGVMEMIDSSGTRRWRRVSVVDVYELGEWERVRRSEEAMVRSRSSSTPVPRAL